MCLSKKALCAFGADCSYLFTIPCLLYAQFTLDPFGGQGIEQTQCKQQQCCPGRVSVLCEPDTANQNCNDKQDDEGFVDEMENFEFLEFILRQCKSSALEDLHDQGEYLSEKSDNGFHGMPPYGLFEAVKSRFRKIMCEHGLVEEAL